LPTQADGPARSEFERMAPYETFRAPPDRAPAELPGTKVVSHQPQTGIDISAGPAL